MIGPEPSPSRVAYLFYPGVSWRELRSSGSALILVLPRRRSLAAHLLTWDRSHRLRVMNSAHHRRRIVQMGEALAIVHLWMSIVSATYRKIESFSTHLYRSRLMQCQHQDEISRLRPLLMRPDINQHLHQQVTLLFLPQACHLRHLQLYLWLHQM